MKRNINIILMAALLGAVSCSKEAPFEAGDTGNGYGRVLTSSLAVQLAGDQTRAASDTPDVKDFTVEFYNTTSTDAATISYKYSEMPEIVVLPAGVTYKAIAHYGDNPDAAWNAPYYYGESTEFPVVVDKIVDDLDPITCKLSNVKVSVNFDSSLVAKMSSDSKVNVRVGSSGELTFTKDTQNYGYFAYVEGSNTLVATFTGTVDGEETTEIRTFSDVKAGVQYDITFRLTSPNAAGNGSIATPEDGNMGINIEAAVTLADISGEIDLDSNNGLDEILLDDESERPKEDITDDSNISDDPNQGDDPSDPTTSEGGPTIVAMDPINLDDWNVVDETSTVGLFITSATGITGFEVEITGPLKTVLEQLVGTNILDLVNPESSYLDLLQNTQLLNANQTSLGGETDVTFDISGLMSMLTIYEGDHSFKITVTDASGETEKLLKLRVLAPNSND